MAASASLIQFAGDPQNALGAQAHTFGCPRGAGGEGQFGGASGHPLRATEGAAPESSGLFIAGRLQLRRQVRFGNHPFGLALFQAMTALRRAEERR
ncbi:hypothetical protein D3C76_1623640 [compost metagenome]